LNPKGKYGVLLLSSILVTYAIVGGMLHRVSAQDGSYRELALSSGQGANRTDALVFVNSRGNARHRITVCAEFAQAQVAAGIVDTNGAAKYTGLHALRHFFASWCINRKVDGGRELPLKVVQGLMGHSTISVTADVYGHLFPAGNDQAELQAAESAFLAG